MGTGTGCQKKTEGDPCHALIASRVCVSSSLCSISFLIHVPSSTEWPYAPGIWNEDQVAGWKKVTDAVHSAGSHIYAQVGYYYILRYCFVLMFPSYGMVCELCTTARTTLTIPDTVQQKLAGTVSDHSLLDSEYSFQ